MWPAPLVASTQPTYDPDEHPPVGGCPECGGG
jgi:hypothetical protein